MEGEGGGWILKRINIQKETEPPTPKNKQTNKTQKQTNNTQTSMPQKNKQYAYLFID